ncbi:MAG: hypothetical protein H7Z41_17430 [Cytophagales bacterium]|nr:hypothetical protein [Armatimonadota bacterium]
MSREMRSRGFIPTLCLAAVLLLVMGSATRRAALPLLRPASGLIAPPSGTARRVVVVLFVPCATLSDWGTGESEVATALLGVVPNRLPWRAGKNALSLLAPPTAEDLIRACGGMGSDALVSAMGSGAVQGIAPGGDPAARAFLAASLTVAASPHRARRENTDPVRLARVLHRAAAELPLAAAAPARMQPAPPLLIAATFEDLLRCDQDAPLALPEAAAASRRAALGRRDALFSRLTGSGPDALPPGTALLVVTPVPPAEAAGRGELLGPLRIWRREVVSDPSPPPGGRLLSSPSTRYTPGLLAPGDIAATVAALLDTQNAGTGRAAVILEDAAAGSLALRVANWAAQARELRLLVWLPWLLAGTLLFAVSVAKGEVRAALLLASCAAPVALLLAGPFASRDPGSEAAVYAVAAAMLVVVVIAAGLWERHGGSDHGVPGVVTPSVSRMLRAVFGITAATVLLDTLLGGPLLARSPLSYSPTVAARFYGIGNEVSGLFLGASLLAVGALRSTPLDVALGGAAVALTLGLPMLGADAGGFAAALIGFAALWILTVVEKTRGERSVLLRTSAIAVTVLLLLLGLYAWGNGVQATGSRTHVGEAVVSASGKDGAGVLLTLIQRKAATGARLLATSPWSVLLVTEGGIMLWVLRGRRRLADRTPLAPAVLASGVAAAALLLLNDSGVVAAATCFLYPTGALLSESAFRVSPSPLPSKPSATPRNEAGD